MNDPNVKAVPSAPLPARTHCAGRFSVKLPPDWTVQGQQQSIYLLKVWTEALPERAAPPQLLRHHAGSGGGTVSDQAPLAGGILLAHQRQPGETTALRVTALLPQGGSMLMGQMDTTVQRADAAHQVISQVLPSWRAQSAAGFCLESGALTIAPSRNERARLALGAPPEMSLLLQTETVAQPVPLPNAEGDAQDARALAAAGGRLAVLAQTERTLAGLPGQERRLQLQADAKAAPLLLYRWEFGGAPADALRPRIQLQLQGPADRRAQLEQAWALATDSLARRP